jgi:hypothetical protein
MSIAALDPDYLEGLLTRLDKIDTLLSQEIRYLSKVELSNEWDDLGPSDRGLVESLRLKLRATEEAVKRRRDHRREAKLDERVLEDHKASKSHSDSDWEGQGPPRDPDIDSTGRAYGFMNESRGNIDPYGRRRGG